MKLHYRKMGEGPALFVLHGLFGSSDNWQSLAKIWAAYFTVYLIDQRNHGHSPWSTEFNYVLLADDLLELMDDVGLAKIDLLGHSMGGKTALQFAELYPEKLNKLIIADIGPKALPPHHDTIIAAIKSVDFTIHTTRKLAEEQLTQYIPDFGTKQFLLKNLYWNDEQKLAWRINIDVLSEKINEIIGEIPMHTCTVTTLFIRGGKSGYITDNDIPELQAIFSDFQFETIADAGHWLHAEKPAEFNTICLQFLQN